MKKHHLSWLALGLVFLSACIPSVHPFYFEKDVSFESRLVGKWENRNSSEDPSVWEFQKSGENAYVVTISEKDGKKGVFTGKYFKLKDQAFLDLISSECEYAPEQIDMVAASMFPGHLLLRVWESEKSLKISFFNFDWVAKYLENNPKKLAHIKNGERLLITAGTRELQRFVLNHSREGELFDEATDLVRMTETRAK